MPAPLPEPSFIERDPQAILAECVALFESKTQRKLEPEQAERLLLDIIAFRESLIRIGVQEACKQNLWRFAKYPMIDFLAELLGPDAARLDATAARTTLRFEIEEAEDEAIPVDQGSRASDPNGKVTFATDIDAEIEIGQLFVEVPATCTVVGTVGNGYAPGQISKLIDPLSVDVTVANTGETADGTAQEDTERMRARLPDAIALQATAGPEDGYRAHAIASHPDVLDVLVDSPEPGHVVITVLASYGEPTPQLLDDVEEALSAEDVCPFDDIDVEGSVGVEYTIDVALTLYKGEDEDAAIAAATEAAEAYAKHRRSGLGRLPEASQIIGAIKSGRPPGRAEDDPIVGCRAIYGVTVIEPSPPVTLEAEEFADCTDITVSVAGYATEARP